MKIKKLIKKIIFLLMMIFTTTTLSPISINASTVNNVDNVVEKMKEGIIIGETIYTWSIDELYNNEHFVKYSVVDNGDSFNMLYDKNKMTYIINGKEYSFETYQKAVHEQYNNMLTSTASNRKDIKFLSILNNYQSTSNSINYDNMNLKIELDVENHNHGSNQESRCMFCPLGTTTPPTTNFGREHSLGYKDNRILILTTSAAIAALAAWATFGNVSLAAAIMTSAITAFGKILH